jgi:peptidoglycan/LPS O-acetylase OafA/YrhL
MSDMVNSETRARSRHYAILDALRFVLAFWVAVGHHGMIPLFAGVDSVGFGHLLARGWNSLAFGQPAVIVFFVISGFCIHLPFVGNKTLEVGRYYLRRYTRILIPVAAALAVYRVWNRNLVMWGEHSILWESPLWSLACEEIYYAVYPLLRWARQRLGWRNILPLAFVAGIGTALSHLRATGWHEYGPLGTALVLLPVWLLGCLLAEQSETLIGEVTGARIWGWRFVVWMASWATGVLNFKAGLFYPQTMIWFGLLAYYWLRQEIIYSRDREPNRYLVAAGAWSYSLYLVHVQGMEIPRLLKVPNLGSILNWTLVMLSGLLFAYAFYLLIERPSHQLARTIRLSRSDALVQEEPSKASTS